jgi:xanthine/uracil permease
VAYCTSLLERKVQFTRKLSPSILAVSILVISVLLAPTFVSMIFMHKAAYAQSSNTNAGFGETTNLSLPNGKSIPIKYIINSGKLLGVVLDKSRATN